MNEPFPAVPGRLRVDVWSDVACPWCYIGKRRFEKALAAFPQRDRVDVVWRSFELDPGAPALRDEDSATMLGRKYGRSPEGVREMLGQVTSAAAAEGLDFRLDGLRLANTALAHALIHLAHEQGRGDAMKERLLLAYFTENAVVSDPEVLLRLAGEVGLDPGAVRAALERGTHGDAVRADEALAGELGIGGVPFFVFGGQYGVSGAQTPEVFGQALAQAWAGVKPAPLDMLGGAGEGCDGDDCAVPTRS